MDPRRAPDPLPDERLSPRQMFFGLRGRASRRDFWLYGVAALLGLGLVGNALLGIAGVEPLHAERLVNLLLVWPAVAISVKRWHDRNRAGWWVLINLLPVVGWLWALIDNGFIRGTAGPNRYGDDPLAASAPR